MPTKRSVSEIKTNLLQPALTSVFEVQIGLPRSSLGTRLRSILGGDKQTQMNLMCSEAVLPGSQLATTEQNNDFTGTTERHAYRRIYDETIDLTFYVDAGNYLPIMFFETWMNGIVNEDQDDAISGNYNYRIKYPDDYVATGLKIVKFEKTGQTSANRHYGGSQLEYEFVRSYPRSITSIPVMYDASQLLKVSVQMTYVRYVVHKYAGSGPGARFGNPSSPFDQSQFNLNGFLSNTAASLVDQVVDRVSGSDVAGNIAAGFAGQFASRRLSSTGINILQR